MKMRLMTRVEEVQAFGREVRARGQSLGLVPTMGALHEGHQSLIRKAKQQCDVVLVSIFVNPAQFDSPEDLRTYPRKLEQDVEVLRSLNVDAIFAPAVDALYPPGYDSYVEPGRLAQVLDGACRPGHFRGVATIVLKLFNTVQPSIAYFGQKDFQQVRVIRQMVEDLNLPVRLVVCPIVREVDGLAMSSRNALLDDGERRAATVLYRSLRHGEALVHAGEVSAPALLAEMRRVVSSEPRVQLDYIELVHPTQLLPVERATAGTVALVAARVGPVRLIDNLIFGPLGSSPEMLLQLALSANSVLDAGARIPGLEAEALCRRIGSCRDCAALASVQIPPREFLAKYLRSYYEDLNRVHLAVIGRDAPANPDVYLYKSPARPSRFAAALCALLGTRDFEDFTRECVLTDATRCHVAAEHIPPRALQFCSRHLREQLKLFPRLKTIVVLGDDACQQFQRHILERPQNEVLPLDKLLKGQAWDCQDLPSPLLEGRALRVIYCYHPLRDYKPCPPIPRELLLPPERPSP